MKAFVKLVVAILVVIGGGVGLLAAAHDGAARAGAGRQGGRSPRLGPPGITEFMFRAVNAAGTSWHITAAPAGTRVDDSEAAAIVAAGQASPLGRHSTVIAAGLVSWRDTTPKHSQYVWAIFFKPVGVPFAGAPSPTNSTPAASSHEAPPAINYAVTFVDGTSGEVLASGAGYTPPAT